MKLILESPEQALTFGQVIASCLCRENYFPPILFQGELGAGKTTIIRGIVAGLPSGDEAEVSSPSFNIVNIYPTQPETAHFDLYRLESILAEHDWAELEEFLLNQNYLILMEWSEYMPDYLWPEDYLLVSLSYHTKGREINIIPGGKGKKIYSCLKKF